ncbi:MAG: site-2 protease family protein [Mycobacteriaceae bacterium]|nr:site-2 protease family protein [Mycobacteriaceae bacterium]
MNVRPLHPRASVRPSPVFLAIIALTVAGGWLAWMSTSTVGPLAYFGVFIFVVAGWVVTLCLHEFGHAFTAWRFGDHDVPVRGYLTLNPFKYSNPLLSIVLPVVIIAIGGIGLPGGAVWVRTSFMTKAQRTLVSLAGPFANLVFAVLLLVPTALLRDQEHAVFWAAVAFLGFLQVTAFVLNMLPVPGLDGYGALEPHLSPQTQRALEPAKQWGLLVLIVLLFTPQLNRWFFELVFWFVELSGTPGGLAMAGMDLTRFWSAWF